jgi:uncharacterized protein HemY
MRARAWFILALAHYRNGDWQAADNALQKSIQLSSDRRQTDVHWLLGSMVHWQSGRHDEAREWLSKVREPQGHEGQDEVRAGLAAEATTLIQQLGDG